ncbi:MAG: hypothetical protein ACKPKO_12555, partial [Candidatus Fonsibacter sp.]
PISTLYGIKSAQCQQNNHSNGAHAHAHDDKWTRHVAFKPGSMEVREFDELRRLIDSINTLTRD